MKLIFDTNVVMDVLAERVPFADASTEAMGLAIRKRLRVAITANTVTDLYFLLRKHFRDRDKTKSALETLVKSVLVLDTTREHCLLAFQSPVRDFEDAVLVEAARSWQADFIVTRNGDDFTASRLDVITPADLLERFLGN
jgi:Predicted nucleic acid-binding protein, contains PIN domain